MNKICFGCGIKLQFKDNTKLGYVPEEKYEDSKYCQRCFRLMHYGKVASACEPKSSEDIIKTVNKNAKNVVFLIDFVNLFGEVINLFKNIEKQQMEEQA